jgi:ATP-dependent RNA helicase DDX41
VCELITKKTINLARCKFFCLDEADRLVNDSFRTELQSILGAFEGPKQTILFSATMPPRVKELATHALKHPITVNVGQAGTANKDITQTAICVQEEEKFEALLKVLQRTPPPVLVFANSHSTVDLVYEFLCIKGVEAGCIHSQIDQVNRSKAVEDLKEGHTEVLVATDLLAKGIDFEHKHIEHVINFDLPEEIEQYVHRIGRTGRAGRKGIATTFFNDKTSKHQLLLDLKQLLVQAEQVVPLELAELKSDLDFIFQSSEENIVCTQCGGHGHTIMYCPQLLKKQPKHRRGGMDTVQTRD